MAGKTRKQKIEELTYYAALPERFSVQYTDDDKFAFIVEYPRGIIRDFTKKNYESLAKQVDPEEVERIKALGLRIETTQVDSDFEVDPEDMKREAVEYWKLRGVRVDEFKVTGSKSWIQHETDEEGNEIKTLKYCYTCEIRGANVD